MGYQTTKEFELPVGYEKNGEVHKAVTMKAPTAGDIMVLQKDIEFQRIAKAEFSLNSENPVDMIGSMGSLLTLASILVPRLVTQLGTLTKVERPDIHNMSVPDVTKLVTEAMGLMTGGIESPEDKEAAAPLQ